MVMDDLKQVVFGVLEDYVYALVFKYDFNRVHDVGV